jgi:hypothetical protein
MSSGALAYYLGYILNDYSDEMCRKILSNIVAAMKPGYSKLLMFDFILPDTGASLFSSQMNIHMLAVFSGMERTKSQSTELPASVGLEIIKFWSVRQDAEGPIEAVMKS